MLRTPHGRLRLIGFVEATSFLLLVGIGMPLKHLAGQPMAVNILGSLHGALWILFLLALAHAWITYRWPFKAVFLGGVASVLPFGPFVYDRYLNQLPHEAA